MKKDMFFSCIACGAGNCEHGDKSYPSFCLSRHLSDENRKNNKRVYLEDAENLKIMKASAKIEHDFYCKVTRVEETVRWCREIGVHMCNPILQAEKLNEQQTDVNIVMGLCVGHDSLFYKYSKVLITTLVTKDRVLGHNPAAALYQANAYYSDKLFEEF